jgi:hypothetical protein
MIMNEKSCYRGLCMLFRIKDELSFISRHKYLSDSKRELATYICPAQMHKHLSKRSLWCVKQEILDS